MKTADLLQSPRITREETEAQRQTVAWPRPQMLRDGAEMFSSSSAGPLIRDSHHRRRLESLRQKDWVGVMMRLQKEAPRRDVLGDAPPPPLPWLALVSSPLGLPEDAARLLPPQLDSEPGGGLLWLWLHLSNLRPTLGSLLDCKEIKPVHPTGNQS